MPEPGTSPNIPDHELLRRIGRGSYGEVWLARNVVGTLRAVKVVYRSTFDHERPYEREYAGIQKFEPVSRSHEGFVDILQIGRNDSAGYFYYVMELADDGSESRLQPVPATTPGTRDDHATPDRLKAGLQTYSPRTLRSEIQRHIRLPFDDCVALGLSLARALAHLHAAGLVHRDIKPSNIIFVGGVPKLADIGLVTDVGEARSYVGTEGFIPPEGPGTPAADLFSLGKVLYEASTGKDRQDFPEPMTNLGDQPDKDRLLELNAILHRACQSDPRTRYRSAEEMLAELEVLQRGESVKVRRLVERRAAFIKNFSAAAMLLTLFGVGCYFLVTKLNLRPAGPPSFQPAEPTAMEGTTNLQAYKRYVQGRAAFNQLTPEGNKQAINYLTEAVQLDPKFLRAYEKLFDAHLHSSGPEAAGKAREIADTLEALDANSEEAHLTRGWIKYEDWEFAEAEKQFKLAISANPNRPLPHGMYGCFLVEQGRVDEARIQLQLCDDLDPGFPIVKALLGRADYFERKYAEAIANYQYALSVAENYGEAYRQIATAQEARHEIESAIDAQQQARIIKGENREQVRQQCDFLRQEFREAGEKGYWLERLAQAKAEMKPEDEPYELASLYVRLGEEEQALDWLDKAYIQRDRRIGRRLLLDQCWDSLRAEPRFQALLKKVGYIK